MKNKKRITFVLAMLITAAAACGPRVEPTPTIDPQELMAQVAMTIEAEITQNAMLTPSATATMPPTATPPPLATQPPLPAATLPAAPLALPPGSADNATFISDVTIKDGAVFLPNARFTKTWKIENSGTTTWDTSYAVRYLEGPLMSDETIIYITKPVEPGVQIEISVPMRAPTQLGTARTWWAMMNDKGQVFGDQFYVEIIVGTVNDVTPTMSG